MSFLLHVNILDAFIGSNNGKHIFTFCTLKKRLRMPLITGQLLILLYCSHNVSWSNALYWDLVWTLECSQHGNTTIWPKRCWYFFIPWAWHHCSSSQAWVTSRKSTWISLSYKQLLIFLYSVSLTSLFIIPSMSYIMEVNMDQFVYELNAGVEQDFPL